MGDETPKGYRRADFGDAWARYCPLPPIQTTTTPQPASLLTEAPFSNRNTTPPVAVAKSDSNPHEQRSVAAVAVQKPQDGQKGVLDAPEDEPGRPLHGEHLGNGSRDSFLEANTAVELFADGEGKTTFKRTGLRELIGQGEIENLDTRTGSDAIFQ